MPQRRSTLGLLALAVFATSTWTSAHAADLDDYGYADAPQEVPVASLPQTKVEFGTGWYVRGDIGGAFLPRVEAVTPYGGYSPVLASGDDRQVRFTGSLGGGYSFNKWFRADITGDYNQPVQSTAYGSTVCPYGLGTTGDACGGASHGFVHSYDVLVNGYIDLGTYSIVTPYVGAGVGLGFGHYRAAATFTDYSNAGAGAVSTTVDYGRNFYNFAYALMAGAAFDIFPHTKLDIGYRYLNLGRVQNARFDAHEGRAGLRYMIDN